MYDVTLRRDPATIDAVKNDKYYIFSVYVCSLGYPSCSAHVPYYHLWPARLYNISPHFLINGTEFEKKKKNYRTKMCVLVLSTTFVSV